MSSPPYDVFRVRSFYTSLADQRFAYMSLARLAVKCEHWHELIQMMREVLKIAIQATPGCDLLVEERSLLVLGSKHCLFRLRAASRQLKLEAAQGAHVQSYYEYIERQVLALVHELVECIEALLRSISVINLYEAQVFYRKMLGDLSRYLCEFHDSLPPLVLVECGGGPALSSAVPHGYEIKANEHYAKAAQIAQAYLDTTHPTRLGLHLNYSVLYYEVLKDAKTACDMARQAFDQAIAKLDDLDESSYKDSTLLMQLLRDNITLWTTQEQINNSTQENINANQQ